MTEVDNVQLAVKTVSAAVAAAFAVWLCITPGHALPAYLLAGALACHAAIQLATVGAEPNTSYRIASHLGGMTTVPLLLAAAIAKIIT